MELFSGPLSSAGEKRLTGAGANGRSRFQCAELSRLDSTRTLDDRRTPSRSTRSAGDDAPGERAGGISRVLDAEMRRATLRDEIFKSRIDAQLAGPRSACGRGAAIPLRRRVIARFASVAPFPLHEVPTRFH